jgi:ribosomal protein L16/L10AE
VQANTEFSARDIEGARQLSIKLSAKAGTKVEVTPAEFVARKNQTVRIG